MVQEPRVIFLSLEGLPGATMSSRLDQPDGVSFAVPGRAGQAPCPARFVRQPASDNEAGPPSSIDCWTSVK